MSAEGQEKSRKQQILELFQQDLSRSEIAKRLGVPYQVVYQYTKGMTNAATKPGGGARRVILDNGMPRAEYIRQEFAKGRSRSEIAKELGVPYQVVYAATRNMRPANAADDEAEDELEGAVAEDAEEEEVFDDAEEDDEDSLFPDAD